MSETINSLLDKLKSLGASKLLIYIVVVIAGVLLIGSVVKTGKDHNPIEQVASEVIKKETGVDVDAMLPPDK